jgi:hypothetical protein
MQYAVYLEPCSLEAGRVGQDMYQPILVSRHRSHKAARRALIRCLTGTNPVARDYLAGVNNKPYPIALRYLVWRVEESGRISAKFTAHQLRNMMEDSE